MGRRKSEREFELNLKKVSSLYTQNSRKKKVITYLFLEEHIDQNEIRRTSVSGRRVSRDRRFYLRLFEENLQRWRVATTRSSRSRILRTFGKGSDSVGRSERGISVCGTEQQCCI